MKKPLKLLLYGLLAGAIVAADQITKLVVLDKIPLASRVEALPGLFHFTYVQNTGAAFSSFEGMRWLFVAVFAVLTLALAYEYFKKPMAFTGFERVCLAAVYGGALGNVIDRVRLGYVVDMICLDFMNFPVFNVADIFITGGCILLFAHLILFNKAFWKDDKQ